MRGLSGPALAQCDSIHERSGPDKFVGNDQHSYKKQYLVGAYCFRQRLNVLFGGEWMAAHCATTTRYGSLGSASAQ